MWQKNPLVNSPLEVTVVASTRKYCMLLWYFLLGHSPSVLGMPPKIKSNIAAVAVFFAGRWIAAAMTVRSVQSVLSTGSEFNLPTNVNCGSNVSYVSDSTVTDARSHRFCPNETGRVEASTCGSSFFAGVSSNATTLPCSQTCNGGACIAFIFRPGR